MCEFELQAISPVDGRYAPKVASLRNYFSEFGYIKYRVVVEVEWLKKILTVPELKMPAISTDGRSHLDGIISEFSVADALRVKEIEARTNHDVKAIEYFIKERLEASPETMALKEFVHFTCTSEDINNLAQGLAIRDCLAKLVIPRLESFLSCISQLSTLTASSPLLALTHGQPATPTTFGREMAVFVHRLKLQLDSIRQIPIRGKFNGATGSFNAHVVAYPEIDWESLGRDFVEKSLHLVYQPVSTQIESHDYIAELCDTLSRISTILIGFARDMWMYISRGVLKLRVVAGEVGSSTMPHKVNPIDFENAEGNLGITIALLNFFSQKLPISRLQRDLSDSTVLRNLGVGFAHFLIALDSLTRGLGKVAVDEKFCACELDANWSVLAEPIQTIMRKAGIEKPYEKLKEITRGTEIDEHGVKRFLDTLEGQVSEGDMRILRTLTPATYIGIAEKIALQYGVM